MNVEQSNESAVPELPEYELDDGPLTDEQMESIRKLSPVSNLPDCRITSKLF